MVNDLANAIAAADQKIAEAESELARFDEAFEAVDNEGRAADEHSWRAKLAFEEAQDAHTRIEEQLREEMNLRSELQVCTIHLLFCSFLCFV